MFLLPDGSKPQCGVCHNLTFTTVGLRLTGEPSARYFVLLMGIVFGPPWEWIAEVLGRAPVATLRANA